MPLNARFWRNVAIMGAAHVAVVVTLVGWNGEPRKLNAQSVVWVTESAGTTFETAPPTDQGRASNPPLEAESSPSKGEEEPDASTSDALKNDLQVSTGSSSSNPKVMPRPAAKVERKKHAAVSDRNPVVRKKAAPDERETTTRKNPKGPDASVGKTSIGDADETGPRETEKPQEASEFSWYGKMLHDRFYSEWVQPKTSTPIGSTISTLVRIRIEKDGRISDFRIVRPSGNVVVDESVAAIGQKVTHVDAIPSGLGNGDSYEVNISFALNQGKQN